MSEIFGGTIHYRTAFDATCVNPAWKDAYPDLSKRVRTWAEDTLGVPRDTLKTREFLLGGNFREQCPPRTTFETISRKYDPEGYAPTHWGCRITHPCSDFPHRRWVHDLTLNCRTCDNYRVVVTSSHSIKGYLGEEPPTPEPFVPGIVQSLVTSRHWKCAIGSEMLSNDPVELAPGFRGLLKDAVVNPDRKCPLVYVSISRDSGGPLVNVDDLAHLLCGAAKLYMADSADADPEIEQLLGDYSTWNGGVRVYQPGVNLSSTSDTTRHRFFTPGDIRRYGSREVSMQIVRACCRRSVVFTPTELISIESIVSEGRRRRLHELMQGQARDSGREVMALAVEMEQLLVQAQQDSEQLRREAETAYIEAEIQSEQQEKELSRLQFELKSSQNTVQELYQRVREMESALSVVESLDMLPATLPEVLRQVCALHSTKLVCLPEAMEAAEKARYGDVFKAWELLWSLASVLHPLLFDEDQTAFQEKDYEDQTGFDLSLSEGKMTKKDSKLMRLRQRVYEGKIYDISAHVGLDRGSNCLRVHFAVDAERKRILIGHCGDHLENYSTRKVR